MDLNEAYKLLNFYINKAQGAWYEPAELDRLVDRAQNSLFKTYYDKYATSQVLDDALAPFKVDFSFTNISTTPNGLINTPDNYLDLLGLYTLVTYPDNVTRKRAVEIINEEELALRLNSQVVPVTIYDPIGLIKKDWDIQLYPQQPQAGIMHYLKSPEAPYFAYSLVSGRVIVYDQANSTQLEWSEKDTESILLIALEGLGINLSEADVLQWASLKNQLNFTSVMKQ